MTSQAGSSIKCRNCFSLLMLLILMKEIHSGSWVHSIFFSSSYSLSSSSFLIPPWQILTIHRKQAERDKKSLQKFCNLIQTRCWCDVINRFHCIMFIFQTGSVRMYSQVFFKNTQNVIKFSPKRTKWNRTKALLFDILSLKHHESCKKENVLHENHVPRYKHKACGDPRQP